MNELNEITSLGLKLLGKARKLASIKTIFENKDVDMLSVSFTMQGYPQAKSVPATRLQERRKYLLAHRQELALDTMHFTMGEHVCLSHVINSGFTSLGAEELRAFLKQCNESKTLFKYVALIVFQFEDDSDS